MTSNRSKLRAFGAIYTLGFFFAMSNALPAYINSGFLSQFIGAESVGVIFASSSVLALFLFMNIGRILRRFGNFMVATTLALIALGSLICLSFATDPVILTLLFIAFDVSAILLYFTFDIFLEKILADRVTGTVRGTFLSIASSAWIISPVLAGIIVGVDSYWKIYLASAFVLLPVLAIILSTFSNFKDSKYDNFSFLQVVKEMPNHQSTSKILITNFILQFFYSWMVIYTPIYLLNIMQFDWQSIGIMFTIMLFPFAILEAPLGRLADERFGEKEMLSIGFIIMGLSTILLTFISTPNFWLWAGCLLATRIGASTVEIMNETYFFKKTQEDQPNIVSLFRMTKPLAYIIGPLLATMLLQLVPFHYMFLILGIVVLIGLRYSITLKDTL